MTDRETWLQSIRSNPSDWQAMLVFADWLEESGDLLAAEQWRWIAANGTNWRAFWVRQWPNIGIPSGLWPFERAFSISNNIRCMPTYPLTIEDVEAYLERV